MVLAFLLIAIAWLSTLVWGIGGKTLFALRESRETHARYAAIEERRTVLERDLAVLETPRGEEAAIREAFGVAKPGEEVIVLVPPAESPPPVPVPWWKRIFKGWW